MKRIKIPFSELLFSFSRGSGPGGQNVNKVNSKVTLTWPMEESPSCPVTVKLRFRSHYARFVVGDNVQITVQTHRTQKANREEAIAKLHEMLNSVLEPPKPRRATKPKRSAVLKRLDSKKKDGDKKRLRQKGFD